VADADPPNEIDNREPQATGCVMAQMPTPLRNSHVTATSNTVRRRRDAEEASQPSGVCGVSTMRVIFR